MAKKNNDAWTREDHDTLIEIKTKVDVIRTDVASHLLTLVGEIAKLDIRLKPIEERNLRINADERIKKYDMVSDEWTKFKERQKVYGLVLITLGGVVGAAIKAIANYLVG